MLLSRDPVKEGAPGRSHTKSSHAAQAKRDVQLHCHTSSGSTPTMGVHSALENRKSLPPRAYRVSVLGLVLCRETRAGDRHPRIGKVRMALNLPWCCFHQSK